MSTGRYDNLGFRGSNGQEVDAVDFLDGAFPETVTGISPFDISFGADDLLTIGEETSITFTVYGTEGGEEVEIGVIITGDYIGQDSEFSPHIDPRTIEVINLDTDTEIDIPRAQQLAFRALSDMRVTNDPDFPQSGNGDYPPPFAAPLPICFGAGTLIATPSGARAVEDLRPGDPVLTADGRETAVKWVGRQVLSPRFAGDRACPVRVAKGALGQGLPHRDLVLTPDHALILDGLAINAGALVNGVTITLEPRQSLPDRVTYYHVETEAHEVILANGAPAESYIDYVGRAAFDNYDEYLSLYGEPAVISEMPLPRVSSARMVPQAIRDRLAPGAVA
ncbi:Hint domain-containing protein [Marinibacterium profundimaris]|uniref:Hint domain-containing protein n=1 Tax=Marinibacterium profundimaris TaxID=1679460 RepID=UPI001E538673|nr:Hint domain-containing protein [Marinibacterium profundimaris]